MKYIKWIPLVALILLLTGLWELPRVFAQTAHAITLTWTEPAGSTVTQYNVLRGTVTGGPYTQIGTDTTNTLTGTYVDTAGTGGTQYFYVVQACNTTAACSANSNQVAATFLGNPPPPALQGVAN